MPPVSANCESLAICQRLSEILRLGAPTTPGRRFLPGRCGCAERHRERSPDRRSSPPSARPFQARTWLLACRARMYSAMRFLRLAIDHRADGIARIFGRADLEALHRVDQPRQESGHVLHSSRISARRRGAFLPLIAKSGIDNMRHRFVQIGVVIDDHGVFAAHLADHAFDMRLSGPMRVSFAKDFQTHFARAGKCDQMNLAASAPDGAPISPPPWSNWHASSGKPASWQNIATDAPPSAATVRPASSTRSCP